MQRSARHVVLLALLLAACLPIAFARPTRADLDPAWIGAWMGEVKSPPVDGTSQLEMPVTIIVRQGPGGAEVAVTILRAGALAKPTTEVVANGRSLAFTLDSQGRRARFEGALGEAERMSGTFAFLLADGTRSDPAFAWSMRRVDLASEQATARIYAATLDAAGQKIPMRLALAEGPRGWCAAMEIASQGILDLPVEVVRGEAGFTVTLPAGAVATIALTPNADATVLEGSFTQGAFKGPIRFELAPGTRLSGKRRPQDPQPPFPYETREVRINHPAGHVLAGTLSMPAVESASAAGLARDGRVPAVVLVTGSGPQNRDEELLGHRPFAVIADALARAGIAVLRYDDRGAGESTGAFAGATTLDFASDADIASEWLKRQPAVDPARVGMIGHSEGAMIVPIVSVWQHDGDAPVHPLAFGIALAMPAGSGGATLTRQSDRIMEASGIDATKRKAAIEAHRAVMQAVAARAENEDLQRLVAVMVRTQLIAGQSAPLTDTQMAATVANAFGQVTDPWMAQFIAFDPAPILARLEMPLAVLLGGKDVQVVAEPNALLLTDLPAKSGAVVSVRTYPDANHLFQRATTGLPDEYGAIADTIDPAILADIVTLATDLARAAPAPQIPDARRPAGWADLVRDTDVPPRRWLLKPQEKTE